MTREEAIRQIREHMMIHCIGVYPNIKIGEALDMAISALSEQEERSKGCYRCNTFGKERALRANLFADFCPQCGRRLEEV